MNQNQENNIFINGKQQIIDMLRIMEPNDRNKLIKNIKARNASMAKELSEQSFSFTDLYKLNEMALKLVFNNSNPHLIGLAISLTPIAFQRKVLSVLDRQSAEQAFSILSQDLTSKRLEARKAQSQIVNIAINLSSRGSISLY